MPMPPWPSQTLAQWIRCKKCGDTCTPTTRTPIHVKTMDESGEVRTIRTTRLPDGWENHIVVSPSGTREYITCPKHSTGRADNDGFMTPV